MHPLAGRKQSPEHIAKRMVGWRNTIDMAKLKERCRSLGKAQVGKVKSKEAIEKQRAKIMGRAREWMTGRKPSEAARRKSAAYWAKHPEKHNHYVDGKSLERHGERKADMNRIEYRLWREKVFARDNWTCVLCNERGGILNADHILPYVSHEHLRYDIDNGRTLCRPCHMNLPTHGAKARSFAVTQGAP